MIAVAFTSVCAWTTAYAFCTFDNPEHIDYAKYWFVEVPTPQLIVSSKVR